MTERRIEYRNPSVRYPASFVVNIEATYRCIVLPYTLTVDRATIDPYSVSYIPKGVGLQRARKTFDDETRKTLARNLLAVMALNAYVMEMINPLVYDPRPAHVAFDGENVRLYGFEIMGSPMAHIGATVMDFAGDVIDGTPRSIVDRLLSGTPTSPDQILSDLGLLASTRPLIEPMVEMTMVENTSHQITPRTVFMTTHVPDDASVALVATEFASRFGQGDAASLADDEILAAILLATRLIRGDVKLVYIMIAYYDVMGEDVDDVDLDTISDAVPRVITRANGIIYNNRLTPLLDWVSEKKHPGARALQLVRQTDPSVFLSPVESWLDKIKPPT